MRLNKIVVGGITNINKVCLALSDICALLAFNNFGKSNVLEAILFGMNFLKVDSMNKPSFIAENVFNFIPINNKTANCDFIFGIEFETSFKDKIYSVCYDYSFAWPKKGQKYQIISENLRVKDSNDLKYKSYIKRNNNSCAYLASENGRCATKIEALNTQLLVNKLINYDDLFYLDILNQLLDLKIIFTESLADPKTLFRTIAIDDDNDGLLDDSPKLPNLSSCANFLYRLKTEPNFKIRYNLFKDAIEHLIPTIEDFEPVKIDFKKQISRLSGEKNIPYTLPEVIYDIRVKEKNLNQQISIDKLSAGTKRIFYLLSMVIASEIYQIPLLIIEELENSIHPSLFQKLLTTIKILIGQDTRLLITSHSPYLVQYLKLPLLYIGLPNDDDIAIFKKVKEKQIPHLYKAASAYNMSLGDYIFDVLLDPNSLNEDVIRKNFER